MDKISNLPDFILHRILSSLPREDASGTCELSKRWSSIWDSFPIFEFDQFCHPKFQGVFGSISEYKEKVREFMNVVDNSLQKFTQKKLLIERWIFLMNYVDRNLVSMIDSWMFLALNNGVQEISLTVSTDLSASPQNYYSLPETLFAVKSVNASSTFNRLQKLSLRWVCISENVLRDIVHNCPNIKYFALEYFCGLKTVKISKLNKLESVSIVNPPPNGELYSVSVDAPKLKYLSFQPYDQPKLPSKINLTSCRDLKELHLGKCGVTDDLLHLYFSSCPFLEKLEIVLAPMLRRVRISGQQLKTLCLHRCNNIESIQIDAPSLSLFKLDICNLPIIVSESVSCPMEILYEFSTNYGKVGTSWFLELRQFLGDWPQGKYFTLVYVKKEVCFDLEELGQMTIPSPIKIDRLNPTYFGISPLVDWAALIDGLLWSCHPMIISLTPGSISQNKFIKVLCEKLLDKENSFCCNSSQIKCWRHDLKAVKIESFGGIEDERLLDLDLLFHTLPLLTRNQKVHVKLEWEI